MEHRNSARPQVPQRPVESQPPVEEYVSPRGQDGNWAPQPNSKKKWPLVVASFVVIVLAALLFWFMFGHDKTTTQAPAENRYQAVFLDNGQVFFGKLKNTEGAYLVLENAYYTKKQDIPADATKEQRAAIENNVSLAKVGNEVYGPESTLSIKAEQVLFWQNLKEDSKVSQAIKNDL